MGKKNFKKGSRRNETQDYERRPAWQAYQQENEGFEAYYKGQGILSEEEWNEFMKTTKEPLPTSFRITGNRATANDLNEHIKINYIPMLADAKLDGQSLSPPKQLSWYPDGLAWQLNLTKVQIRKSPEFKKFQNFLVYENEAGNISRQEAVSMIPPLLLKIEPHHSALDMCAAPGSKTAQLLESLHSDPNTPATGMVVANDSDNKRAYLLVHQTSRVPSPNILVTNIDGSAFPKMAITNKDGQKQRLDFDRVLCDVPCSGDGTLRKNHEIWSHWTPADGNGLHSLQLRILKRGINILKQGGRIVYSTCSMNPVENEAVIAAALQAHPEMKLVDAGQELPTLKRREGLKHWKVCVDKTTVEFGDRDTVLSMAKNERELMSMKDKLPATLWPPSREITDNLHLERCLRVYSHLQNTGSFFIAVLEKSEDVNQVPEVTEKNVGSQINNDQQKVGEEEASKRAVSPSVPESERPTKKSKKNDEEPTSELGKVKPDNGFKEDPFSYLKLDDPDVEEIIKYYELNDKFPRQNLLVRNPNQQAGRTIYLTSEVMKNVIESNDYTRLRLISCGVKMFIKHEVAKSSSQPNEDGTTNLPKCKWRITNEGVNLVKDYLPPHKILTGDPHELKYFVETYHPSISKIGGDNPSALKDALDKADSGSHVIKFSLNNGSNGLTEPIYVPIWKSRTSVSMMVDKKERSALSLRLFGEDISEAGKQQAESQRKREEKMAASVAQGQQHWPGHNANANVNSSENKNEDINENSHSNTPLESTIVTSTNENKTE